MTRPIAAHIDLAALSNNLHRVRQYAPASRLWAVVKANAYGHGLRALWTTMATHADGFALLNIEDGIWLRQAGWEGPVLLLEGFFDADELRMCEQYGFTTALHSDWQLALLEQTRLRVPLGVYLKLNSGMNRLGFPPLLARERLTRLQALPQVGEITLMAHFADADKPDGVQAPLQRLAAGTQGFATVFATSPGLGGDTGVDARRGLASTRYRAPSPLPAGALGPHNRNICPAVVILYRPRQKMLA